MKDGMDTRRALPAAELAKRNKRRKITQVCYVTDDYQKTIEYLTVYLQFGPWTIIENSDAGAKNTFFREKNVKEWKFYVAFTFIGDMQIEVIQPVSGPNPYEEFKDKRPRPASHKRRNPG